MRIFRLAAAIAFSFSFLCPLSAATAATVSVSPAPAADRTAADKPTPAKPRVYTAIGGIPVVQSKYAQNMIKKYIAQYTTSFGAQELYKTLDNGEHYRLYVREQLKKRNMPKALEYLPVVESNYQPLAVSRSGAKGLWQFMENSIKGLLKKNAWIDERFDPYLSTDAALTKLQDNYRMFRDWPLAIAAYNCGAGAMQRILKKAKVKTFWYIAEHGLLRDQSVQYVPKLLAITELSEHGSAYGIALPKPALFTRYADFDYIELHEQLSLERLESELRMKAGTLTALNPALIKKCTPSDAPYALRLPAGMELSAQLALSDIRQAAGKKTLITHTVQKGDTLYALSRQYGVTVAAICTESGMHTNESLSIGKVLYIPVQSAENK